MKTAKRIMFLLILAPVIFTSYKGGEDKMFKGKYPLDVYQSTLLVQYLDTAKRQKWVPDYRKEQAKQWKRYKFNYEMIDMKEFEKGLKTSKYSDTDKYRYILTVSMGRKRTYNTMSNTSTNFTHYYFSFYDRKTEKEFDSIDTEGGFGGAIADHLNEVFKEKISDSKK